MPPGNPEAERAPLRPGAAVWCRAGPQRPLRGRRCRTQALAALGAPRPHPGPSPSSRPAAASGPLPVAPCPSRRRRAEEGAAERRLPEPTGGGEGGGRCGGVGLERGVTQLTGAARSRAAGGRGAGEQRARRLSLRLGVPYTPPVSLGNLQLKAAASHSTMYPGNKRKKLWREEKGTAAATLLSRGRPIPGRAPAAACALSGAGPPPAGGLRPGGPCEPVPAAPSLRRWGRAARAGAGHCGRLAAGSSFRAGAGRSRPALICACCVCVWGMARGHGSVLPRGWCRGWSAGVRYLGYGAGKEPVRNRPPFLKGSSLFPFPPASLQAQHRAPELPAR